MTDGVREQDWQILQSEDLEYLRRTRGEIEAHLDTSQRWRDLMKGIVGAHNVILADTRPQGRLLVLLEAIDRRITELTQGRSPSGESPAQQQKSVA